MDFPAVQKPTEILQCFTNLIFATQMVMDPLKLLTAINSCSCLSFVDCGVTCCCCRKTSIWSAKGSKAHKVEVCADYCLSAANELPFTAAPEASNVPLQKEAKLCLIPASLSSLWGVPPKLKQGGEATNIMRKTCDSASPLPAGDSCLHWHLTIP